jgi:hypothetical protein
MCPDISKICTHDHLLASKAGILYVPDTNDIKIVTGALEYEFDTGDVSTRLSFDEIRERLSDISDDILVYAVDMLIQKLGFNLAGDCIF